MGSHSFQRRAKRLENELQHSLFAGTMKNRLCNNPGENENSCGD